MRSRAYPRRRAIEALKASEPATCRLCGERKRSNQMADWLTGKKWGKLTKEQAEARDGVCKECFAV